MSIKTLDNLSIQKNYPHLVEEWYEEKNGLIENYDIKSKKKVWWICPKDKHHIWETQVRSRCMKSKPKCPICLNQIICPVDQCNSLFNNCREQIRIEWNSEKNGNIMDYTPGSNKKVAWICSKDKHHEWETRINHRIKDGVNCPICANHSVCQKDFCNSFYNQNHNNLKKEWNEEKNGSMKNYIQNSTKKVWWICSKVKHHEWEATIIKRTISKRGCPICSNNTICQYDYCNSLYNYCDDKLKKQWVEEKNGSMKNYFRKGGDKIAWWKCLKVEHHVYQMGITNKLRSPIDCPYCSYRKICPIDQCNSLYYNCSDLMKKEWNEKKNGSMKKYSKNSMIKVFWICSNDNHHEWEAIIRNRNKGDNCPICSNKKICPIDHCNSLFYSCPDEIKKEWNEKKNGSIKNFTISSGKKVWWKCKKNHEWKCRIVNRTKLGNKCVTCIICPSCKLWRTGGKLCIYCSPTSKIRMKTKELDVVNYLRRNIDIQFEHNKSLGKDCNERHLFPDIRYDCIKYNIIVEVDEFRHRGSSYDCDKQRMYDIVAKIGLPCIFIRYNPDNKNSNKNVLVKKIEKYLNLDEDLWDDYGFYVEYLFY